MVFYRGQKVVFIGPDLSSEGARFGLTVPKPSEVYTIRSPAPRAGGMGYLLVEIVNRELPTDADGVCEISINAEWLRPLVERKTDISIFTCMLTSTRQTEPA